MLAGYLMILRNYCYFLGVCDNSIVKFSLFAFEVIFVFVSIKILIFRAVSYLQQK